MSDRTPLAPPEYTRSGEYLAPGTSRPGGPGTASGTGPAKRDGLRVEPPATGTRRRMPELILGILLIAGCALAAVLLALSGRSRTDVVALDSDLVRGDVIEASDLTTAQVGTDGDVAYVPAADVDLLVGKVALTDLEAGVLVTSDMLGDPVEVAGDGDGLVGVVLSASELPTLNPAAGDVVNVMVSPQGETGPGEFVAQAQITSVAPVEDPARQEDLWHVSLRASEAQSDQLAVALTGDSQVKLVLVGD